MRQTVFMTLVIGLLGSLPACAPDNPPAKDTQQVSDQRPSVLLITFDTTRADHLGPYGYQHTFTPTLNALAKKSVVFEQAFSPVPLTLPAHTSIMTGLYPFYHGVRDNSRFVLDPSLDTLAEALQGEGYQTSAVVAAFVLDSHFQIDQGFDHYDDDVRPAGEFAAFQVPERDAGAVTDAAIRWLDSADASRPFFLWVHYYDPHSPYRAPESFVQFQGHPYDVEIAYTDTQLRRLLDHLDGSDHAGRPRLTVFCSDHGEALGQYGEPTHGYFVYDSTLHVPLMIRLPNDAYANRKITTPVSLVDIMPTVLELLDMQPPGENRIHGRSLARLIRSAEASPKSDDRPLAFECYEANYSYGWATVEGVRIGSLKYIRQPTPELYELSVSPEETPENNQYTAMPERASQIVQAYERLWATELAFPLLTKAPQAPSPEIIEKLRALGYAASSVPADEDATDGEDLKKMLPYYRKIIGAMADLGAGDTDSAIRSLINVLEELPGNKGALWTLGHIATQSEHTAELALPVLEQSIRQQQVAPGMVPLVLMTCGRAQLAAENPAAALEYFKEVVQIDPDHAAAHRDLGLTMLLLGRTSEAIVPLEVASDRFGVGVFEPRVMLMMARLLMGDAKRAISLANESLKSDATPGAIWRWAQACPRELAVMPKTLDALGQLLRDDSLPTSTRSAMSIIYADALLRQDQARKAMTVLEATRDSFPADYPLMLVTVAKVHLHLGENQRALDLLEQACRQNDDLVTVVGTRARVMAEMGKTKEATQLVEKYYEAHPDDPLAANNLAWILAQQEAHLDRALKVAKQATRHRGYDAGIINTLGWIYHLKNERQFAIQLLGRAAKMDPSNADYHYHLAVALEAAGQTADALNSYRRALELAQSPQPSWYSEAESRVRAEG